MTTKTVSVHRFHASAAVALPGKGETCYMTEREARELARALIECARDIKARRFTESRFRGRTVALSKGGAVSSEPRVINVGDVVTCTETGKSFTVESDGFTYNFARNSAGEVFSDEGVNIRELRDIAAHGFPVGCYVSSDGRTVTGWKGNKLGDVVHEWTGRSGFARVTFYNVRDAAGKMWRGKNGGRGMCITLHPMKDAR